MGQNTKSSEMLVTRKLPKTKSHQMIKSKAKVKDTSGNANRKKAGARFYYQTEKKKKNSRSKAHRIRTAPRMSLLPMHHHKLVSYSSYFFPKPFQFIYSS